MRRGVKNLFVEMVQVVEIPSDLVRTVLCQIVESKLKTKEYKINVNLATKDGENNFVGVVYRVTYCRSVANPLENETNTVHSLIVKVAPQHLARRKRFHSRPGFLREMYMLNKVLPFFQQFEQSKGISEVLRFHEYPKCYGTGDGELNEYVFLEDLNVRGFNMIDKSTEAVTADHVKLVMQTLGKLHAISFALKDQQPDKFNELASALSEEFIRRDDSDMREYLSRRNDRIFDVVADEEFTQLSRKLKTLFERDCLDIAADCLDAQIVGSAAIIIHGDVWQNNIMFHCKSDGKPSDIKLLDWQTSRYTSPVIDFCYFIFCCTTKELRDAHYEEFQKVYYENLCTHIHRLGSDPEKVFPFKLMLEHFSKFARFGLVLANLLLPVVTTESGNGANLDEVAEQIANGKPPTTNSLYITDKTRNNFEKRLRDVIIDMVRLEYI